MHRFSPINQPHKIPARLIPLLILHRHTAHQQLMQALVGREQHRRTQINHLLDRILARRRRYRRIQPLNRRTQPLHQHHLPIIAALRRIAIDRDVRAVQRGIANLGQPA